MSKIHYAIISGSSRPGSQSRKVSDYLSKVLTTQHTDSECIDLIDLAEKAIPFWDEIIRSEGIEWHPDWAMISKKLQKADAIVIVVPEWNGMMPPQLLNFLQLCCHGEFKHKPGLIVSISSGNGGTYPVVELRMSSFKNTQICYLPEHLIIRNVDGMLNDFDQPANEHDERIRQRILHTLALLNLYAVSFQPIRESEIVKNSQYPYGM